MGTCKTSLPWGGKTLLTYQIEQWLSVDFIPVVVCGLHNIAVLSWVQYSNSSG
ncbi:MAG: hypothetical protein MET45_28030 [Nostoc sp. LLA-1]|nr:hypothetical protein [Cyanocohniella sp. LLY]